MKKKNKRIGLIDGDLLAYVCAAAAEERSIKVTHSPTGITKSFKNRTEFKEKMQSRGKEITEDYSIEDIQEAESPAFCFKVIRMKIEKYKRDLSLDEVEIWTDDINNFRLQLPLPSLYKGQRDEMIRPLLLKEAKGYLKRSQGAHSPDGCETDDVITYRAYEELSKGNLPVVISFDKDSMQCSGLEIYNEKAEMLYVIPELGHLTYHKTKGVKGSGVKFLCLQWMWGDPSDNYHSAELAEEKFGAKSAFDILEPLESPKECIEAVVAKFKQWYPEPFVYKDWRGNQIKADWRSLLDLYFKCCYMKRSKDDPSDSNVFFHQYDVDPEKVKPYEKTRKETPKGRKVQSKEKESGIQSDD